MVARTHRSHSLVHGKINLANMAMFRGASGWPEHILRDAGQVGIATPLLEIGSTCHVHVPELVRAAQDGCYWSQFLGGQVAMPTVNDNWTQGHNGGNASLPMRNYGADSLEAQLGAHGFDALFGFHVCDKAGPALALALARLNLPGLILSGGTIRPRCHLLPGGGLGVSHIGTTYAAAAAAAMGQMTTADATASICNSTMSAGGCGTMASFNTFGCALEAMGLMPIGSSSIPGDDVLKMQECRGAGQILDIIFKNDLLPRMLITYDSLCNAAAVVAAIGGSTNATLHLVALAREAGIHNFTLQTLKKIFRKTPIVCNFSPRGKYAMYDLHLYGGTRLLFKYLLDIGILNGNVMTVLGQTLGELLNGIPTPESVGVSPDFIAPPSSPFREFADLQIGEGNLGEVTFKIAAEMDPEFRGPAICFDSIQELVAAAEGGRIKEGSVIVLRYQGPAAKGMPELLVISSRLKLIKNIALFTDGRMSGVSGSLFMALHAAPEAWVGGPIALIQNGDEISLSAKDGTAHLNVSDEELARRKAAWQARPYPEGMPVWLRNFCTLTAQSNHGCVSKAAFPECA